MIELLVVISIVGFLASSSVVVFNKVRIKSRDTKILTDVNRIMAALELFRDNDPDNGYPGEPENFHCLKDSGFCLGGGVVASSLLVNQLKPYLPNIPRPPINDNHCGIYDAYVYLAGAGSLDSTRINTYVIYWAQYDPVCFFKGSVFAFTDTPSCGLTYCYLMHLEL